MTTIHGGFITRSAACTAASTTSAVLDKRGYAFGMVDNQSGGAVTITYYGTYDKDGVALAVKDQDGVAVSQVVGDDECWELPTALAGIPYIVPVLSSGTATLTFHFER